LLCPGLCFVVSHVAGGYVCGEMVAL
jgi:hypothetical protein